MLARISEQTGVSVARLRQMTFERFEPVYRDDEARARFAGRRYDTTPPERRAHRFAVCGPCLEGDAKPYLRTQWLIGWMAVCPQHGTVLVERCDACHAGLRVAPFATVASFSPATCTRCAKNVLDDSYVPAHPSVTRMQAVLWRGKCEGVTELEGLGRLTWKEMVALADVLIGMVWTGLTLAEQQQIFRLYTSDILNRPPVGDGLSIYDDRHGSLRFLAWLLEGWPDSPGAKVGLRLLIRWLAADRNRLCRHLRPLEADLWSAGPTNFEPPIRGRLRLLPVLLGTGLPRAEAVDGACPDRTPEVMIKVVSQGSQSLKAIRRHFGDIHKGKNRALETDDGEPVTDKAAAKRLVEDWDLDLEALLWHQPYLMPARRTPPKLVHKLIFSMPAGTRPERLLAAVRSFAQEEFDLKHRYALALHTDEPHPHVHVVVKAMSQEGVRLNIRKATLRKWRQAFACQLRAQGVAAKATQRAVRNRQLASTFWNSLRRGTLRAQSRNSAPVHELGTQSTN